MQVIDDDTFDKVLNPTKKPTKNTFGPIFMDVGENIENWLVISCPKFLLGYGSTNCRICEYRYREKNPNIPIQISLDSEVSRYFGSGMRGFTVFSYFSAVVCLRCLLHHILSLIVYTFMENREFVFISIVQFMISVNSRISFDLQIVFVCLYVTPSHYHHCANFIWRHWTYKMPVRYNFSSVWVRLSIFSQFSIIQYAGLCVFSLPIPFVMIERIYMLCLIIIIKSEVWTTHCLGLGHETMVCAVCLSIFLSIRLSTTF